MLKVLGSMLILLASVGFGFQIQMDLKNHLRLLYDIRKLLFDIANETAYTMDSMEVAMPVPMPAARKPLPCWKATIMCSTVRKFSSPTAAKRTPT